MTVPARMKALILKSGGYSSDTASYAPESLDPFLEFGETAVPVPDEGQVLVRVRCSSVNPSDVMFIQGAYGQPRIESQPAGFEAVGDVVAAGADKASARMVGHRVAFIARSSGSWAEYAIADTATLIPLREDVRDEDGAAMIVNPLTAIAMFDIVRESGSTAFVMSAAASQLCKLIAGLAAGQGYTAISIVRRDSQIEHLKSLGVAHVLNSESDGFDQEFQAICRVHKPVMFLDALTGPVSSRIFHFMGRRARWMIYGRLSGEPTVITEPGQLIFQSKQVEGFWLVNWMRTSSPERKLKAAMSVQERFASGEWETEVAAHVKLSEAHRELPALLARPNEGKIMLVPG